jgi:hypothetical protein
VALETSLEAAAWRVVEWSAREVDAASGRQANFGIELCKFLYQLIPKIGPKLPLDYKKLL